MKDPRVDQLADMLLTYSLEVKPKQRVLIQGEKGCEPLMMAAYAKCLEMGAYPFPMLYPSELIPTLLKYGNAEDYDKVVETWKYFYETFDARLRILGEENTKEAAGFDTGKVTKLYGAWGKFLKIVLDREARGEMKWVATLFPTNAYAQDANMSLEDYSDFVFRACMPDSKDPVGYWKNVAAQQDKIIAWLKGKDKVHVTAPGTDLTLSVKGRPFINCASKVNVPDGEVFTSPVEDSAEGYVHFTYPSVYEGNEVQNVRLEFQKGKVVKATAEKGQDFLLSKLDTDDGARYLGEFAIGTNEGINRFTGQILFDEKIGGSFHLAVGHGYPESLTQNTESAIHWDMVCDLRNGGQITVDGELFYKDGKFAVNF